MEKFQNGRNVDTDKTALLVEQARDWAVASGILMVPKDSPIKHYMGHAPFTLFPSFFPKTLFLQSLEVQRDFNVLVDRVSKDREFLLSSLESASKSDEFTRNLFEIYNTTQQEGLCQNISLGLLRSDYMMNPTSGDAVNRDAVLPKDERAASGEDFEIKQIEINTIASSFAGLGSRLTNLHRYVQQMFDDSDNFLTEELPNNDAVNGLAKGLADAWGLYDNKSSVILFVQQRGEKNRVDQRILEYALHKANPAIRVIHRSMKQVEENAELKQDKSLVMDDREIAVVYFRAGYTPRDYYSKKEWSARLKMERSRAIKCPTVAYQLVGTKKIQQVLAEPGMVERFIDDPEMVERIRKTFAGLFSLDSGADGDKNAEMAMANPERFVVKPQREGGGNNIYGDEIAKVLSKKDGSRTQYILMEKISPPVLRNHIVQLHKNVIEEEDVVCELGVFGVVISDGDKIISNVTAGHLLRTKSIIHNDGGVAALRAVLDSPYLI